MKYIRFISVVILLSAFILAVVDGWQLGLRVSASSSVSINSLWNYPGVHCDKGNVLYRHSFLDNLRSIAHCIKGISVLLVVSYPDKNVFQMKLTPPFADVSFESLLSQTPSVAERWDPFAKISINSSDHHLVNTDNFEFIWLNAAKTVMHAGMYYNPLDTNSPKFSFSANGVSYTAGDDSYDVLSDGDVKYLDVNFTINTTTSCVGIIDDSTPQNCPGPNVSIQVTQTDIPAGDQAAIQCTIVSPLGILLVNWTLDDNTIDLSKTKYEGIVHGTHTLKIYNFQSDDSGRYRCIAATAMGTSKSPEVQIQMIGPPSITVPTQEYTLAPGTDMTLACTVQANPVATAVYWKINGVNISPGSGVTLASPSLTISNADESDLGIYECCATNTFNTLTRVCGEDTIMVKGDPSVQILTKKYEYILGDSLSLNCDFISYPGVEDVFWKKDGVKLSISGQLTYGNFTGSPVLQLNNMAPNDRAVYQCCVENIILTTCGENIVLGDKPIVSVPDFSVNEIRNISSTIVCNVDAYPNAGTVSWNITLDDTVVVHTGAATAKYDAVSPSSPQLIVKATSFEDSGVYVCIAENEFGFGNSADVSFSVYGVIVEAPVLMYDVIYGESVELNCTVTYAPDLLSVTWMRATTPVSVVDMSNTSKYSGSTISHPHLTIHNLVTDDADDYYCKASNAHEEMESSHITLRVNGAAPTVTISQSEISVNTSDHVTLSCTYTGAIPDVTSVKWYKEVNAVVSEIVTSPFTPSLTLTSVVMTDAGHYTCSATNAVGQSNSSSAVELKVNQVQPMCPCDCAYKRRLDYWASQDVPNHTMEEWRVILASVLDEIKKNLTVDKTNLSATIRKLSSAPDGRQSSKSVGFVGIALISFVCVSVILIDLTSVRRHIAAIRGHGSVV